jgi:hypothetical protein
VAVADRRVGAPADDGVVGTGGGPPPRRAGDGDELGTTTVGDGGLEPAG